MKTVLVCDDDIAILDSIEIYLKQEGFNVLKAVDGELIITIDGDLFKATVKLPA